MRVKFLGAAEMVTGSSYLLTGEKTSVLVDMGMFQGLPEDQGLNYEKPKFDANKLSAVVLTHAHLDHCGLLPVLVGMGFKGPIFMTEATKRLAELVLFDAAKIAKEDSKKMIYTEEEVIELLKMVVLVDYDREASVGDFAIKFVDAGHILGSASVIVEETSSSKRIVFSGDLGNTPEPLLSPTHWIDKADYVVVESTYGDEIHGPREEMKVLSEIVEQAVKDDSVVLIPTFSLQRSQELLYLFDQMKKNGMVANEIPVFLDSPMAIKATEVFRDFPELYSKPLQSQSKTDDPFDFPSLVICDSVEKSRQIKNLPGAKIIIAGSGMMTGGRILHHAVNYLGDPLTQIVFVGYQAEGTLGRQIKDGKKTFNYWGNVVEVKAQIKDIKTMSSHADQIQVITWLKKIKGINKVILTHGEEIPRLVLKEKIKQEFHNVEVFLPKLNQEINLEKND